MVAVNTPMVGRAAVNTDALLHTKEDSTSKKIGLISSLWSCNKLSAL